MTEEVGNSCNVVQLSHDYMLSKNAINDKECNAQWIGYTELMNNDLNGNLTSPVTQKNNAYTWRFSLCGYRYAWLRIKKCRSMLRVWVLSGFFFSYFFYMYWLSDEKLNDFGFMHICFIDTAQINLVMWFTMSSLPIFSASLWMKFQLSFPLSLYIWISTC